MINIPLDEAFLGLSPLPDHVSVLSLLAGMELSVTHQPVTASVLPAPVGPYSPGVQFDRLIFVSGQGATDPTTGELAGSDAAAQTAQCLRNVQAILRSAGSDPRL